MTSFTPSTVAFQMYEVPPMRVSVRIRLALNPGSASVEKTVGQVWPHGRW